jgi:hypothetical protein
MGGKVGMRRKIKREKKRDGYIIRKGRLLKTYP